MAEADERERMELGWKLWGRLLWQAAFGEMAVLGQLVGNPERWRANRAQTVVTMSDQIPVWMLPDAGSVLMSRATLEKAVADRGVRRRRRELAGGNGQAEAADQKESTLAKAPGNPANSRCIRGFKGDRWGEKQTNK